VVEDGDGREGGVRVRLLEPGGSKQLRKARLALPLPYQAAAGDRVLVASDNTDSYVIGVLYAAHGPSLQLSDGARAELVDDALLLRDAEGSVLLRYQEGGAEIRAASGDLTLAAPLGRVVLRSGLDVELEAERDVVQRVGRRFEVQAGQAAEPQLAVQPGSLRATVDQVQIRTKAWQLVAAKATTVAHTISSSAKNLTQMVDRYELDTNRLVERARDAFRDVSDLLQSRAGRMRTLVKGVQATYTRRTVMVSKDDTSIDGKRVLLG